MRNHYILLISIIFICGLIGASSGLLKFAAPNFLVVSVVILFVFLLLFVKTDSLFIILFSLLIFLLGVIRYDTFNVIDRNHIKSYTSYLQKKIFIQGKIVSDPEESRRAKRKTFILEANTIKVENRWERTNGLVLVNTPEDKISSFRYGDIVVLEGSLKRPFLYRRQFNFDYVKYLAHKKIYSMLNVKKGYFAKKIKEDKNMATKFIQTTYSIRSKLESCVNTYLEPPYNSVLVAVLLGKRLKIPPLLNDLFAKTGTFHILAISGLHVGIIYFLLRVILKILRVHKNLAVILSISCLISFTILTGARASILRATAMLSMLAFGEVLKRKISIFNLIGLSSLMILIVNPNQIFDLGFILSYAAVLSIVCISPIFYEIFLVGESSKPVTQLLRKVKYYLLRSASISLAAWLGTGPLMAYYFGLITPVVVVANLVVIPLLFTIMGSGILLLSLGLLSRFLAIIFSQSAWFFLFILVKAIKFFKNLPWSYFVIKPLNVYSMIFYYIMLLVVIRAFKSKNQLFSS